MRPTLCSDDSIRTVMQQVDHSVSAFNPRSIISVAINRNDTSAVADTILRRVFEESIRINRFSHGAFDPTVGPLADLWGFGPSNATFRQYTGSVESSHRQCAHAL